MEIITLLVVTSGFSPFSDQYYFIFVMKIRFKLRHKRHYRKSVGIQLIFPIDLNGNGTTGSQRKVFL
jgi:hypothetical protein